MFDLNVELTLKSLLTEGGPVHAAVWYLLCGSPASGPGLGLSLTCAMLFLAKAPSFFLLTLFILCPCGIILLPHTAPKHMVVK